MLSQEQLFRAATSWTPSPSDSYSLKSLVDTAGHAFDHERSGSCRFGDSQGQLPTACVPCSEPARRPRKTQRLFPAQFSFQEVTGGISLSTRWTQPKGRSPCHASGLCQAQACEGLRPLHGPQ